MNRPDGMPDDVWADAEYAVTGPRPTRDDEWSFVEIVASAILAERERCAMICEARRELYHEAAMGFPRLALSEAASSIRALEGKK